MRLLNSIIIVILTGLTLCGCTESQEHTQTQDPRGLKVNITDGDQFPEYLVGTWRQQKGQVWREFVFTEGGYLESVVLEMGSTRIYPGQTTEKPLINGGHAVFVPGPWDATLTLSKRELGVEINIDSFKMQVRDQVLEGKMKEYFIGTVSEDGLRWETQLISMPEYYATTKEQGTKTLMPGDEIVEEAVTFNKVLPEDQE